MKKIAGLFSFFVIVFFTFSGCRKTLNNPVNDVGSVTDNQPLIQQAIRYFHDSLASLPTAGQPLNSIGPQPGGAFNPIQLLNKTPDWTRAKVMSLTVGQAVVVPLQFKDSLYARPSNTDGATRLSLNKLCNLIIYSDVYKNKHAEVLVALPDQDFIAGGSKGFSGVAFVTDWKGNYLKSYRYQKGLYRVLTIGAGAKSATKSITMEAPPPGGGGNGGSSGCTVTDWYSCTGTEDDPYETCTYTGTTETGCDDGGSVGVGSGSGTPSIFDYVVVAAPGTFTTAVNPNFAFKGPTTPVNIATEMQCFTPNASSRYFLTICVEEPAPGSGSSIANGIDAGHTYLTFEQDNADGSRIVRNDGFYPATYANPISPSAASAFGDNSTTGVSITMKISVNYSDFMIAARTIQNEASNTYNLYTFNCTTAVLKVMSSIGITDLDVYAAGSPFTGNYPGNLGATIRDLNLSDWSAANGNRQAIRTPSGTNTIMPPSKTGTCNPPIPL